ncbi:MAG: hypothetical protein ACJ74Y_16205 [Bryobacteraceae bacterium]
MNWWQRNWNVILWGIATAVVLWVSVKESFVGIAFTEDLGSKVPGLLGSLLLVSLFVERVIEVFVSIWRDEDTDRLEQQLANFQDTHARRKQEIVDLVKEASDPKTTAQRQTEIAAVLTDKRQQLNLAEVGEDGVKQQLVPKYAHTRRVSTWVGLAVGVLTAAVGFRFFHQIVNLKQAALPKSQMAWFTFVDVLLTGAILAGGSKAIHNIFSVYETFMNSTEKRASASAAAAAAKSANP